MVTDSDTWVHDDAGYCPVCGGLDIVGDAVFIEERTATQECSCNSCNSTWTGEYTLVKYTNLVDERPVPITREELDEFCKNALIATNRDLLGSTIKSAAIQMTRQQAMVYKERMVKQ